MASPTLVYPTSSPGPKQGILLNPYSNALGRSPRRLHNSLPLPVSDQKAGRISATNSPNIHPANHPLPRTDSGSSTNSTNNPPVAHSRTSSIRKIRFAPLPDPRALEEAELAQLDSPTTMGYDDSSLPVTPGSAISHTSTGSSSSAGVLGLFNASAEEANTDTTSEAGGSMRTVSNIPSATKAKSKHWGKRLFQPLLKSTTGSKDGGSISDDQLWRTPSRDSVQSTTSNEGVPLGRRMTFEGRTRHSSLGSAANNTPLTRVQSAGNPQRKRMLNGRVYGVKPNAFANVRTDDPDFVEWGHGGAGAVHSRHSAGSSKYAGVQSGGKLSIGAIASPASSAAGGDEDDGSGMAWVKRRREQKEREKREQEEKERQKAHASASTTTSSVTSDDSGKEALEMPVQEVVSPSGSAGVDTSGMPEEHHIVRAIAVPAPPHVHGHPPTLIQSHDVSEKPSVPSSEQSTKSSSDEEDEEEDEESDTTEDEDEDDEEDDNEHRKTALGAGVEKVSRHKDQEPS